MVQGKYNPQPFRKTSFQFDCIFDNAFSIRNTVRTNLNNWLIQDLLLFGRLTMLNFGV